MKSNKRKILGIMHIGLRKCCELKIKIVLSDTFDFFPEETHKICLLQYIVNSCINKKKNVKLFSSSFYLLKLKNLQFNTV